MQSDVPPNTLPDIAASDSSPVFRFGEFVLNVGTRRLTRNEAVIAIVPKGFDLLRCLVERSGRVVSREELLRTVWADSIVEEGNLSQQIFGLRRALGECASYITTVPGRGYQFTEPVVRVVPPEKEIFAPAPPTQPSASPDLRAMGADRRRSALPWAAAAAAALVAVGAWWGYGRLHPRAAAPFSSVLLADFRNSTGSANLDTTLRQAMEIELGQSPFVQVLSRSEVGAVLQQMGRDPQAPLTQPLAREICERGNQQVLVTGEVARLGQRLVLTVQASECAGGRLLAGSSRSVSSEEDLLGAVNATAAELRQRLGETAGSLRTFDVPIERATTPSLEALKAYSLGTSMEERGHDSAGALRMYQRAVDIDPAFALGYQALANIYYANDEEGHAAEAARRAFDLSEHVTERERFAIQMHFHADAEQDLNAAVLVGRTWAAAYPHDWKPLILMAGEYNDMGQYPQAIAAGRQALALSADQALIYSVLARAERRAGNFAAVRLLGQQAVQHGVDSSGLHSTLYQNAFATGDDATLEAETAWGRSHGSWLNIALEAEAAAYRGRLKEARRLFALARAKAMENNLREANELLLLEEAQDLFAYGDKAGARALSDGIKLVSGTGKADLAVLRAQLGDRSVAASFLEGAKALPKSNLMQEYEVPRVRATLALASGNARQAVQLLEPTRPYELGTLAVLPLRAEAALKAGGCADAMPSWQEMLANPGVDPVFVYTAWAHLGMARCYAASGDKVRGRAEYTAVLEQWKDADVDLPEVVEARREFAALH